MTCILSDAMLCTAFSPWYSQTACSATVYKVDHWERNQGKPRLCHNPVRRDGGEDSPSWRNIRETSTIIGTELIPFITRQFLIEASVFIPVLLVVKASYGLGVDKRSYCG